MCDGSAAIQWDLNRMENWAGRNLKKFNKQKCAVLHLGRNNLYTHQDRLWAKWLKSSFAGKDTGILVDTFIMRQQRTFAAKKAKSTFIRKRMASRLWEVICQRW